MDRDDVDSVVGDEVSRAVPPAEPPPDGAAHRRRPRHRWLVPGTAVPVLVSAGVTVRSRTDGGSESSTAFVSGRTPTPSVPAPTDELGCPGYNRLQGLVADARLPAT